VHQLVNKMTLIRTYVSAHSPEISINRHTKFFWWKQQIPRDQPKSLISDQVVTALDL